MALEVVPSDDLRDSVRAAIAATLPEAEVEVVGGDGHVAIRVVAAVFAGKGRVARQRLVYGAIAALMSGEAAPVHAVDRLETLTPEEAARCLAP